MFEFHGLSIVDPQSLHVLLIAQYFVDLLDIVYLLDVIIVCGCVHYARLVIVHVQVASRFEGLYFMFDKKTS